MTIPSGDQAESGTQGGLGIPGMGEKIVCKQNRFRPFPECVQHIAGAPVPDPIDPICLCYEAALIVTKEEN